MTDYKVNHDVGYFGTDNPATAVAERMPFVVQTDGKTKFVNIGIVVGRPRLARRGHHRRQRPVRRRDERRRTRRQDRVASRVCLFVAGCTRHALIEGMIYAAKQAQRRRHQHVDRRPAGAQRRQQRPRACSTTG